MPSLPPAPFGAASASEWLSEAAPRLSASTAPEIASRLAQIAFLTAALERRYHLPELTDAMLGDLAAPLSALPQQLVHLPASHPAHRWFQLAALAEFHGEPQLSRLVTNAIADTLGEHDASRAIECGFSPDERDELLALCLCRRGRVSRAAGALLDAQYHFEDAVALLGADRHARGRARLRRRDPRRRAAGVVPRHAGPVRHHLARAARVRAGSPRHQHGWALVGPRPRGARRAAAALRRGLR